MDINPIMEETIKSMQVRDDEWAKPYGKSGILLAFTPYQTGCIEMSLCEGKIVHRTDHRSSLVSAHGRLWGVVDLKKRSSVSLCAVVNVGKLYAVRKFRLQAGLRVDDGYIRVAEIPEAIIKQFSHLTPVSNPVTQSVVPRQMRLRLAAKANEKQVDPELVNVHPVRIPGLLWARRIAMAIANDRAGGGHYRFPGVAEKRRPINDGIDVPGEFRRLAEERDVFYRQVFAPQKRERFVAGPQPFGDEAV